MDAESLIEQVNKKLPEGFKFNPEKMIAEKISYFPGRASVETIYVRVKGKKIILE